MAGTNPAMTGICRRSSDLRWLKRGMDAGAIRAADAKVRETVEDILAQVDERKDAAIREMSEKFDKWSPKDFRLSPQEIERALAQVPKRDLDDIRFEIGRAH